MDISTNLTSVNRRCVSKLSRALLLLITAEWNTAAKVYFAQQLQAELAFCCIEVPDTYICESDFEPHPHRFSYLYVLVCLGNFLACHISHRNFGKFLRCEYKGKNALNRLNFAWVKTIHSVNTEFPTFFFLPKSVTNVTANIVGSIPGYSVLAPIENLWLMWHVGSIPSRPLLVAPIENLWLMWQMGFGFNSQQSLS